MSTPQNKDEAFDAVKTDKSPELIKVVKKQVVRSPLAKLPSNPVLLNKNVNRVAQKTVANSDGNETEEQIVEKILAKRFNPRRREHEYLIKWEHFTHEQNTWEPQSHLASCPQLLDTFEKQLARQKEQRAALAAKQAAAEAEVTVVAQQLQEQQQAATQSSGSESLSPIRPARSSKAKAMDQVKQWCADNEEEANKQNKLSGGIKRKVDDSEYENEESEDDSVQPAAKLMKRDASPAVTQALLKAGQTGSVRIVPVNKSSAISPKVNGTGKSPEKSLTDNLLTNVKEGKQTGIVKKPGAVLNSAPKSDAQIRVVQKGEAQSSGVVRINNVSGMISTAATTGNKAVPRQIPGGTTIKSIPAGGVQVRQSGIVPKPTVTTKPAPSRPQPANVTTIRGQSTVAKTTITQRSSSAQQVSFFFWNKKKLKYHLNCLDKSSIYISNQFC